MFFLVAVTIPELLPIVAEWWGHFMDISDINFLGEVSLRWRPTIKICASQMIVLLVNDTHESVTESCSSKKPEGYWLMN